MFICIGARLPVNAAVDKQKITRSIVPLAGNTVHAVTFKFHLHFHFQVAEEVQFALLLKALTRDVIISRACRYETLPSLCC